MTRSEAAVSSLLAESLARAALIRTAEKRATAVNNRLHEWSDHSVLFDMILADEGAIRARVETGQRDEPMNVLLSKTPNIMPRAITTWEPKNTAISTSPEGVEVVYKDRNGRNLLRVVVNMRRLEEAISIYIFLLSLMLLGIVWHYLKY